MAIWGKYPKNDAPRVCGDRKRKKGKEALIFSALQ